MMLGLSLNIGLVWLAAGLLRTPGMARVPAAALGLGALLLASAAVIDVLGAVSCALLLVGMAPEGFRMLRGAGR
jgi:hypothetical protein